MQTTMRVRRVLCGLAWLSVASLAGAGELPRDFASAYRPALEIMKKTYTHCTIEGTISQDSPPEKKSIDKSFILRVSGTWSRLDARTTGQKGIPGAVLGGKQVFLATPAASLQTFQKPTSQMFDTLKEDSYSEARTNIRELCPLNYAYSFDNQITILDMLSQGDVKITSFKKGRKDGQAMLQIKYEQAIDPAGQYGPWQCELLISLDEGYALREYKRTTGQGASQLTNRGLLTYNVDHNGIPLISHVECRREQGPGSTVLERATIDVSKFINLTPFDSWFGADSM